MPTYEYRCDACGHEFELYQQITAPVKRKCPKCGKPKLQRLIGTGAGVLFKGGGFYETDYRSDSYKKAAEADKKAAEPAAASADSSTAKGDKAKTTSDGAGQSKAEAAPAPAGKAKPAASPKKRRSR